MTPDLQSLVEQYLAEPTEARRQAAILGGVRLVRSLAGKLGMPNHPLATREDLENSGIIGLLQALDTYDPARGVKFITYAYRRIRGELVDYLRSIDALSRSERRKVAEAYRAMEELRQILGSEPEDQDVADYLGIALSEYHALLAEAHCRFALSLEMPVGDDGQDSLLDTLASPGREHDDDADRQMMIASMQASIAGLPERERTILALYYIEELTLREIGQVLQLTEARISQLLGKVLLTLRMQLMQERAPVAARAR